MLEIRDLHVQFHGSDHEAVRGIDLTVQDVTGLLGACGFGPFEGNVVKAVVVSDFHETRKFIDKTLADVEVGSGSKPYWFKVEADGSFAGGVAKFMTPHHDAVVEALGLTPGTLIGIAAGKKSAAQKTAGVMRKMLGALVPGHMDKERYEFCWVVDFPMYEIGEEYPEVAIEVIPGVTAALGGSAVLGAAVGHDVSLISLSDLLTPWELIEERLLCAAKADFVICLYNPSSRKRSTYLAKACEIMLEYKAEDTVCGIVKNIAREGETMQTLTLKELKETTVDMFSTVFIGNKQTKVIREKMVTPRGYRI